MVRVSGVMLTVCLRGDPEAVCRPDIGGGWQGGKAASGGGRPTRYGMAVKLGLRHEVTAVLGAARCYNGVGAARMVTAGSVDWAAHRALARPCQRMVTG